MRPPEVEAALTWYASAGWEAEDASYRHGSILASYAARLEQELENAKKAAGFLELTGTEKPEDELKAALAFEEFDSKEQMMCGWQSVHRELHVVASAYRALALSPARETGEKSPAKERR